MAMDSLPMAMDVGALSTVRFSIVMTDMGGVASSPSAPSWSRTASLATQAVVYSALLGASGPDTRERLLPRLLDDDFPLLDFFSAAVCRVHQINQYSGPVFEQQIYFALNPGF